MGKGGNDGDGVYGILVWAVVGQTCDSFSVSDMHAFSRNGGVCCCEIIFAMAGSMSSLSTPFVLHVYGIQKDCLQSVDGIKTCMYACMRREHTRTHTIHVSAF